MLEDFPSIAAKMSGTDEFIGNGGLYQIEQDEQSEAFKLIDAIKHEFSSSSDVIFRGSIIAKIAELLETMKACDNWTMPEIEPERF